jgi:hypothetical protein
MNSNRFAIRRQLILCLASFIVGAGLASAQQSPPRQAMASLNGKKVIVAYSAPSVRGRKVFGAGGLLSKDPTYPVWRAGANAATAFQTEADITVGNLSVPKGIYTLFIDVKDPNAWELIISKETGQWGLDYHANQDLGRVKMQMSVPPTSVEQLKYTITAMGGTATLEVAWEKHLATVPIVLK